MNLQKMILNLKSLPEKVWVKFVFWLCLAAVIHVRAETQIVQWPESIPKSDLYQVSVWKNGSWVSVHTHYSAPNLSIGPDGNGVTGVLDDRTLSWASFSTNETVHVQVEKLYGSSAETVEVLPGNYNLNPWFFDGKTVRFSLPPRSALPGPAYISINFQSGDNEDDDGKGGANIKNAMMIFADPPEEGVPVPGHNGVVQWTSGMNVSAADVIYFGPGDYDLRAAYQYGVMRLNKNGQKIYIADGAYIRGAFHGEGYDNLEVRGRGVISGMDMVWHEIRDENGRKDAFLNFMGSSNCEFSGLVVNHPTHHTWPSSKDNVYRRIKVIGWASNHDGIRPSDGSLGEELFIKTSDDLDYARDDHVLRNSVIWPMRNGAFGQLGWNNLGAGKTRYRNLYFINTEWIYAPGKRNTGIIGSVLQQGVNIKNDTLENIYCDGFMPMLANMTIEFEASDPWNPQNPGVVSDFLFRNIVIEKFRTPSGQILKNPIKGFVKDGSKAMIKNISFVNLVAGNTIVTQENYDTWFDIDPNTTSNITFSTEGDFYTVNVQSTGEGMVSPDGAIPVPAGTDRVIHIQAEPGNRIGNVVLDGTNLGRVQTLFLPNVQQDHSVQIEFVSGSDFFDLGMPAQSSSSLSSSSLSSSSFSSSSLSSSSGVSSSSETVADIADLQAESVDCSLVRLTWSDVAGEDGYRVRRKEPQDAVYVNLTDLPAGSEFWNDSSVIPGTTYIYMVRPLQNGQAVALSNTSQVQSTDCPVKIRQQDSSPAGHIDKRQWFDLRGRQLYFGSEKPAKENTPSYPHPAN
jgi:hypothetical protein